MPETTGTMGSTSLQQRLFKTVAASFGTPDTSLCNSPKVA